MKYPKLASISLLVTTAYIQVDQLQKIKMPVINKYINSFFFFIIEKKISHFENKDVVIISENAVN